MDEQNPSDPKNSIRKHKKLTLAVSMILMLLFVMAVIITRRFNISSLPETGAKSELYIVDSLIDEEDLDIEDGICDVEPSPEKISCTLRAAIQQSNNDGQPSRIEFSDSLKNESGIIEIVLNSPLPEITEGGESSGAYDLEIAGNIDNPDPRKVIIRINSE